MKKNINTLTAYAALAAVCLIWGTTYLAMRMGVQHFPPFLFAVIRQLVAGGILIAFLLVSRKTKLPSWKDVWYQSIAGFFMISLGNGLVAWAEVHIPSGIAAVICSLVPLVVILINLGINTGERPNIPIFVGTALGFVGISTIFAEDLSQFANTGYLLGIIVTFIAVIAWAGGSIWLKHRKTQTDLFMNVGLQMFSGGLWLIPFSLAFDDLSAVTWSANVALPMAYLILVGSIIAFSCYLYALRHLPMTIVSLYAYVNPIIAVVLGWLILDEKLNATMGIAILLTIAGIYIVNRGHQLRDHWKAQVTSQ
ncbi:MAG TPA: EamA family transporter [Cyclobacteriaceae bacterium]|nr:EamA family transporter [Cyclobacteriaceae bacterium]